MDVFKFVTILLGLLHRIAGIVNPNNETAQMVIYLQKPSNLGPSTWASGVSCLDQFTRMFFQKRENLTRSPNMVITVAIKMSTPAAQIQEGFLKVMMEAVSEIPRKRLPYQLRIVSDAQSFHKISLNQRELVLADYYIVVVDSIRRLKNLMENYVSHTMSWNPGARFLVLYNNVDNRQQEQQTATAIFEEMLNNFYVHRVALLYATSATRYSFLLMDYYNSSSCRNLKVKPFAECQEGQVVPRSSIILEKKLERFLNSISLNNCTFYMCASIAAPFIEEDCVYGLEMRIIGFIKSRLKFNINQKCEHENRGVEESYGNWTGLLGRLNDKACDFIMGGFYPDNDVIKSFWTSDTYLQDAYTWFVKLASPRPAWKALYAIFSDMTWLAFVAMLVFSWLIWSILVKVLPEPEDTTELSLTAINSMAVSICVSVQERPLCAASRIFFFSLALYGMNVTSTYTSKLIAVFTNPGYLHQIDNLDEVVEEGMPFGGYEESRDWFENEDDMWIFKMYNDSIDFEPSAMNLLHVKTGERVILSSRMFTLQSPMADYVYAFPGNVFSSPMQMIMKPGFPFLYDFNLMIRYMRDFGFFDKINKDFIFNNTYLNRIAKLRPDFQENVIVLTTEHLQGPFAILVVGVWVSILLFLGELFTHHIIKMYCGGGGGCCTDTTETSDDKKKKKQAKHRPSKHDASAATKRKRKSKKKYDKSTEEVVIAWNELNMHRDMRLTPLKRRIVHFKPEN